MLCLNSPWVLSSRDIVFHCIAGEGRLSCQIIVSVFASKKQYTAFRRKDLHFVCWLQPLFKLRVVVCECGEV